MPAIDDRCDVDIDDIAFLELAVTRNAVTHDMVDRGAAAVGETAIAECRRNAATSEHQLACLGVDLFGRHSFGDEARQLVEHMRGELARLAHPLEALGAVQLDRAIAHRRVGIGNVDILVHGGSI